MADTTLTSNVWRTQLPSGETVDVRPVRLVDLDGNVDSASLPIAERSATATQTSDTGYTVDRLEVRGVVTYVVTLDTYGGGAILLPVAASVGWVERVTCALVESETSTTTVVLSSALVASIVGTLSESGLVVGSYPFATAATPGALTLTIGASAGTLSGTVVVQVRSA